MSESISPNPQKKSWFGRHPVWAAVLAILLILLIILALLQFLPVTVEYEAASQPAANHDEALALISAIQEEERASGEINPICESNVISHGEKVDNVIIFFHGFTSCPEQFRELGQQMFGEGYNVYIPRMPHHGKLERSQDALRPTSAEELAAFTAESVVIAQGLGERVVVSGLSGGGTIAAWTAQELEGVDRVITVAPFLGIGFIPAPLNRILARVIDVIPNINMWWDPTTKADNPNTADYSYPGYPLHALAEYLRLGYAAHDAALRQPPAVQSITVINNANDKSVNNAVTNRLVEIWKSHAEETLRTYEFENALGLPHDVITPDRENGDPAIVYPVIIDSIEAP